MSVDRKFEVIAPSLDRLVRKPLEVANTSLLNPNSTSPLALVDGELVQISTGKWDRASSATAPAFFSIEDRGDYGVQASRKLSVIAGGGSFWCNTVIFNSGLTTAGVAVMYGAVTIEGLSRAGLIAHTSTNLVLGYVMKPAAINNSKLQVFVTCN
jgi:hypothetical protein